VLKTGLAQTLRSRHLPKISLTFTVLARGLSAAQSGRGAIIIRDLSKDKLVIAAGAPVVPASLTSHWR
jgi:hypothetical protein